MAGAAWPPYRDNVLLNLSTCFLIISGGIGFLVMVDVVKCRFRFRKFTLHSKVVVTTTAFFAGSRCPVIKVHRSSQLADSIFPERISPHGRLCHAGSGQTEQRRVVYDSYPDVHWRFAGVHRRRHQNHHHFLFWRKEIRCIFSKQRPGAFRRALPANAIAKASTIGLLGMLVVCCTTFLLCILEPGLPFISLLFEAVSAYSTAGLSTGITAQLCLAAKLVLIFTMYTGRVGAFYPAFPLGGTPGTQRALY